MYCSKDKNYKENGLSDFFGNGTQWKIQLDDALKVSDDFEEMSEHNSYLCLTVLSADIRKINSERCSLQTLKFYVI